jgi:hypothetical protein
MTGCGRVYRYGYGLGRLTFEGIVEVEVAKHLHTLTHVHTLTHLDTLTHVHTLTHLHTLTILIHTNTRTHTNTLTHTFQSVVEVEVAKTGHIIHPLTVVRIEPVPI